MAKLIPWQDLDKIIAKIVPRSCQDLTKISMEGQPGPTLGLMVSVEAIACEFKSRTDQMFLYVYGAEGSLFWVFTGAFLLFVCFPPFGFFLRQATAAAVARSNVLYPHVTEAKFYNQ